MPIVTFASELVAEVARRNRGRLRRLSVDLGRGILHATVDGRAGVEEVHIDGAEFELSVRPRSASLIEWAEFNYDPLERRSGDPLERRPGLSQSAF